MQSAVKLDIVPREIFTNINCVALTYIFDATHNLYSLVYVLSTQILSCEVERFIQSPSGRLLSQISFSGEIRDNVRQRLSINVNVNQCIKCR